MSCLVPAAPITKAVRSYFTADPELTQQQFSLMSGVNASTVNRVLLGCYGEMNFYIADRLLCAMDRPELWMSDAELNEAYYDVDLSVEPKHHLAVAKLREQSFIEQTVEAVAA